MPCGSDNCYWSTDTRFKKEAERLYNSNRFNYFNYFDPFMYNVGKRHTTRFLKTIWPFFYIMHEGISYIITIYGIITIQHLSLFGKGWRLLEAPMFSQSEKLRDYESKETSICWSRFSTESF